MSVILEILEGLWNIKLKYKGVPTRALCISVPSWGNNQNSYRSTLSRMCQKGLVEKKDGYWLITESGKKYLTENKRLNNFSSPFNEKTPKNLLFMFDVPESRQTERKWLRKHLINFNYFMLQKSVWIGPSPLPQEFLNYLKEIKLTDSIKTFKLAKPYVIKSKN